MLTRRSAPVNSCPAKSYSVLWKDVMIDWSTLLHTAHTNKRIHTYMHRSRWRIDCFSNVKVLSLIVNTFMFTISAETSVYLTLLTDTVVLYTFLQQCVWSIYKSLLLLIYKTAQVDDKECSVCPSHDLCPQGCPHSVVFLSLQLFCSFRFPIVILVRNRQHDQKKRYEHAHMRFFVCSFSLITLTIYFKKLLLESLSDRKAKATKSDTMWAP